LLLKVRKELFSCLFKNFEGSTILASPQDYSNLLPYFLEYTRLDSERKNHANTLKKLKAALSANPGKLAENAPESRLRSSRADSAGEPAGGSFFVCLRQKFQLARA
jgi:hypothetical protein